MIENKTTLLVVDDDPLTCTKVKSYFDKLDYTTITAANGDEMWQALNRQNIALILLDIGLPGKDGLELAREVRVQHEHIAIIMLTGRDDEIDKIDKIVGLESGADDYVTKPFNSRELLARVKNLLRRVTTVSAPSTTDRHQFEGWSLDIRKRKLTSHDGSPVTLTRGEFDLLSTLVRHPGAIQSRERLTQVVCHRDWDPTDRTIDVLVRRLRNKIEPQPDMPEMIITVRGEGYVFTASVDA